MATLKCFENLIWLKITIRTNKLVQLNLSFLKMFNNTTIFKHFQSRDHKMTSLSIRSIIVLLALVLTSCQDNQKNKIRPYCRNPGRFTKLPSIYMKQFVLQLILQYNSVHLRFS